MIKPDYLREALLGTALPSTSNERVAVYDLEAALTIFETLYACTHAEAVEHLNTLLKSYPGEPLPIFVDRRAR